MQTTIHSKHQSQSVLDTNSEKENDQYHLSLGTGSYSSTYATKNRKFSNQEAQSNQKLGSTQDLYTTRDKNTIDQDRGRICKLNKSFVRNQQREIGVQSQLERYGEMANRGRPDGSQNGFNEINISSQTQDSFDLMQDISRENDLSNQYDTVNNSDNYNCSSSDQNLQIFQQQNNQTQNKMSFNIAKEVNNKDDINTSRSKRLDSTNATDPQANMSLAYQNTTLNESTAASCQKICENGSQGINPRRSQNGPQLPSAQEATKQVLDAEMYHIKQNDQYNANQIENNQNQDQQDKINNFNTVQLNDNQNSNGNILMNTQIKHQTHSSQCEVEEQDQNLPASNSLPKKKYTDKMSTNYFINDFAVNDLPETNPLQRVINDFVGRRLAFQNKKNNNDNLSQSQITSEKSFKKPTLEQFLKSFQDQVYLVNKTYKSSKQQFESDMKAFKDCDLIVDDNDLLVLQETDPNQDPSK